MVTKSWMYLYGDSHVISHSLLSFFFFFNWDSTLQRANLSGVMGLVVFLYSSPHLAQRTGGPGLKGYTGRSSGFTLNLETLWLPFFVASS